ncbi:Lcl C-terminal domain-containing protein [Leptospira ainazelensis]|uniref:Lcl C-terminal domain-containing protein n=1 Tax=Leptospira ainazelensis TaxID=2810034 RepID=UPI0019656F2E|nr:DUF1566 domain-containing protein [Leptospira ainazelensis]
MGNRSSSPFFGFIGSIFDQSPSFGSHSVSGQVIGLNGPGLVLKIQNSENSNSETLAISSNGKFQFPSLLPQRSQYTVTVVSTPLAQVCSVRNATGLIAAFDIDSLVVVCSFSSYSVKINVSGLFGTGLGLVVKNNGTNPITIDSCSTSSCSYTFSAPIADGGNYDVTVETPIGGPPSQVCSPSGTNSGLISGSDVVVNIVCSRTNYLVSVNVKELTGDGLVIRNNGEDRLIPRPTWTPPAAIPEVLDTFTIPIADGGSYNISIPQQPSRPGLNQTCSVQAPSSAVGFVWGSNVTIQVICSVSLYKVHLNVTGLSGSNLKIQNNLEQISIPSNGTYTFSTEIADRGAYSIGFPQQPGAPGLNQTCSVFGTPPADPPSVGTIDGSDITVLVLCSTNSYDVHIKVIGLAGTGSATGPIFKNNSEQILIPASPSTATYTFPTRVADGGSYRVVVDQDPINPNQSCSPTGSVPYEGSISGSGITVEYTCVTNSYFVKVNVTGLQGLGLKLTNNGVEELRFDSDGIGTFPTAITDHSNYVVTITEQPTVAAPYSYLSQTCSFDTSPPSIGTIAGGSITIPVVCSKVLGFTYFNFPNSFTGLEMDVFGIVTSDSKIKIDLPFGSVLASSDPAANLIAGFALYSSGTSARISAVPQISEVTGNPFDDIGSFVYTIVDDLIPTLTKDYLLLLRKTIPISGTGIGMVCFDNSGGYSCDDGLGGLLSGFPAQYGNFIYQRSFGGPETIGPSYHHTTKDKITGLVWKTCLQGQSDVTAPNYCSGSGVSMKWPVAQSSCVALNSGSGYAGIKNWRLPKISELATLVFYGTTLPPLIQSTYFPNQGGSIDLWSNTQNSDGTGSWFLQFSDGFSYDANNSSGAGGDSFRVRCVSGGQWPRGEGLLTSTLIDRGDGTIEDTLTKLRWRKCSKGLSGTGCLTGSFAPSNWKNALSHCTGLGLGPAGNPWRLPSVNELRTLVDHNFNDPALVERSGNFFPNTQNGDYWTATTFLPDSTQAFIVSFADGTVEAYSKTGVTKEVRCVTENE